MRRRFLLLSLLTVAMANPFAQADTIPLGRHPDVALLPRDWALLYDDTTLFPRSTAWREIPWLINLNDAVAAGKKENRPIQIWVPGNDPLERC
ncbi:MAG: hypothetical protein EXS16_06210 [Gemmataceae bacterium]|nr:hypothetical protein [Gemmataceae bacterium]